MTATAKEKSVENQWHHLPVGKVAQNLDSNLETGLTSAQVAQRQEENRAVAAGFLTHVGTYSFDAIAHRYPGLSGEKGRELPI